MGAEQIGLKANLDLSGWTKNVNQYLSDVQKLNAATAKTAGGLTGSLTPAAHGAGAGMGKLGVGALTLATGLGNLAAQAVTGTIQAFGGLAKSGLDAVASFERFTSTTKAMLANEMQLADATLTLDQALDKAAPRAAELLKWIEKLAIQSPFSVEDVKDTFSLAQAYGFTSDQAQRLTTGVLNWGAATGKTGATLNRVVLALGQMSSLGKVAGGEVRQLAEAGLGVDQILATAMNKTTAEIKTMREAGLIPAGEALNAIIGKMEGFGNAAAQQSGTLTGLLSSLGDIGPMIYRNLLGPLDETTGKVGGIFGALQPRLAELVNTLSSDAFNQSLSGLGEFMGQYAEAAFGWGENLMIQFANGIVSAAVAVMQSLMDIGGMISSLLSPGSPPALLPDIDKWGASAMTEFVDGFTGADFSAFDELTGTIESFLRALPEEVMGKANLIPTILGSRSAIAEVLASTQDAGQITDTMINQIIGSLGAAGEGLDDYIRSMFTLETANQAVSAAQAEVDRLTKEYQDLLKPLDDEIDALDTAEQNLADTQKIKQLELMANDPNATAAEKERARLQIAKLRAQMTKRNLMQEKKGELDNANAALDAEKEKQRMAQEQFNNQKSLLGLQSEQNKLMTEQIKLLEQLAKAVAGGLGAGGLKGGAGAKLGGLGGLFAGLGLGAMPKTSPFDSLLDVGGGTLDKLISWFKLTQYVIGQTMADIGEALAPVGVAFDAFMGKVAELGLAFVASGPKIKAAIAEITTFVVQELGITLPTVFDNFGTVIETLTAFWRNHGDMVIAIATGLFKFIIAIVAASLTIVSGIISGALTLVIGLFDMFDLLLKGNWEAAWETVKTTLSNAWAIIVSSVDTALDAILAVFGTSTEAMGASWQANWENIKTILAYAFAVIVSKVTTSLTTIWTTITTKVGELKTWWETTWTTIQTTAATIWAGILSGVTGSLAELWLVITTKLTEVKEFWTDLWDGVHQGFQGVTALILLTLGTWMDTMKANFVAGVQGAIDAAMGIAANALTIGEAFVQGIIDGVLGMAGSLYNAVSGMISNMFGAAQATADSHSPSERARKDIGQSIGQGMTLGVLDSIGPAMRAMQDLTGAMFNAPALSAPASMGAGMSVSTTNNYNLSEHYNTGPRNPRRSFAMMRALSV